MSLYNSSSWHPKSAITLNVFVRRKNRLVFELRTLFYFVSLNFGCSLSKIRKKATCREL